MSICVTAAVSVTAGATPVVDENGIQSGSGVPIKRIPSESTVNRIAKHLNVPSAETTWERSQSAANIDASTLSDNDHERTRPAPTNTEQQPGPREVVPPSTVSGQTRNYWDLPSAISHEDDAQRDKLLSNSANYGVAKKRRGGASFRTSLETISQYDELQLCGNSDANSYESVLTNDEHQTHGNDCQQVVNGVCHHPQVAISGDHAIPIDPAVKTTQSVIVHSGAHRTASCDVMLTASTSGRERIIREPGVPRNPISVSASASYTSAVHRGVVQRTRSGSSNQPHIAAAANHAGIAGGSSNLLETDSASSNLLESASDASSNSNLIGSAGGLSSNVIGTPSASSSNLLGTRLFGGANLNLAAVGDRDESLTDNEPSSNVSASSSVVFGTPLTSNSRVEVVVITTPNGSDSDLNQ